MEVMDISRINSVLMWAVCGIPVLFLLWQAAAFFKRSYKTGKEIGIDEKRLKKAIKTSAITSIGPSMVVLSGLLSVLVIMGGPVAFMRLSFVGNTMFELMAAGFGAAATGVKIGVDTLTEDAFAAALWVMILGSVPWIIVGTFSADKMEKFQKVVIKKVGQTAMPVIATAALLGSLGSLNAGYYWSFDKTTVSCLIGGVLMAIFLILAKKLKLAWLQQWSLTFAIIPAMIITALI